jgi:hypothetical protein
LVVFYCDDYAKMLKDLEEEGWKIGEQTLHLYLRHMIKMEIIADVGRKGKRNHIYALGCWYDYGGGSNWVPFYKMEEFKEDIIKGLKEFTL